MDDDTQVERLSDLVVRLRCPNPGPMTLTGTNTYIVGAGGSGAEMIVIDPGPDDKPNHLRAITQEVAGLNARIGLIAVTHAHPDHLPGALLLAERTGAPIAAHNSLESRGVPLGLPLINGLRLRTSGGWLVALHLPGHAREHVCYLLEEEDALFSGDHILGQGTTVVAPPNGDMTDYMKSLRLLQSHFIDIIYPGHGDPIADPQGKIEEYIAHRTLRENQVLAALGAGVDTVDAMIPQIYAAVNPMLWPAAARQVKAHLIKLERDGKVRSEEVAGAFSQLDSLTPEQASGIDATAAAELGFGTPDPLRRYSLT